MYSEDEKKSKKKTTSKKKENEKSNFLTKIFRKRTRRLLSDTGILFEKLMWAEIIISLVMVIFGAICLLNPEISVKVISVIIGLGIIAFGVFNLYCYRKVREISLFRFHLIYGVIALIIGVITVLNPFLFSQVVTIFIGLWILYLAFVKIDLAIRLKIISEACWMILLVTAVLQIFMSILIFINPFSNLVIAQVVGTYLILSGVLNIANVVMTKNRAYDFIENL